MDMKKRIEIIQFYWVVYDLSLDILMRAFQLRGFDRISSAFCKGFECFKPTLSVASLLSAGMPFVCEKK